MEQSELISMCMRTLPEILRNSAEPVWFKKNQTVICKGERTTHAYLMVVGDLNVQTEYEDGSYYSFAHILPGRYISDLEVLSGRMINAVTLVAVEDSMALRFPLNDFMQCLESDLNFLRVIVYGLADAMFDTSYQRGQNLYTHSKMKLSRYLLRYVQSHMPDSGGCITVKSTRQAIAAEIGMNIKTINRAVKRLRESGLVSIYKGKIRLCPEQITALERAGAESESGCFLIYNNREESE